MCFGVIMYCKISHNLTSLAQSYQTPSNTTASGFQTKNLAYFPCEGLEQRTGCLCHSTVTSKWAFPISGNMLHAVEHSLHTHSSSQSSAVVVEYEKGALLAWLYCKISEKWPKAVDNQSQGKERGKTEKILDRRDSDVAGNRDVVRPKAW